MTLCFLITEHDSTLPTCHLKIQWGKRLSRSSVLLLSGDGYKLTGCKALVTICRHILSGTYAIISFLKVIWNPPLGPGPWAWRMFFLEGTSGFPTVLHCSRAYRHSSAGHSLMPHSHTFILLHYCVDTESLLTDSWVIEIFTYYFICSRCSYGH